MRHSLHVRQCKILTSESNELQSSHDAGYLRAHRYLSKLKKEDSDVEEIIT